MEKLLPLFSKSFRNILIQVNSKYESVIAQHLLTADSIIEWYNNYHEVMYIIPQSEFFNPDIYVLESTLNNLSKLINDSIRMITLRQDTFTLSFLPKNKKPEFTENNSWARKNRQDGKPTALLKRLIENPKQFSDVEYEIFNNQLKSICDQVNEFMIVEGNDISRWYHEDTYASLTGTLGSSCMRHEECQEYFEIYERYAKMLILVKDDRLCGRAILWEINDKTYMDRIYVVSDYLENSFIDYAKCNGFYFREHQSLLDNKETMKWFGPDDNYQVEKFYELNINLKHDIRYFPYMDTFRYLYDDDGYISTNYYDHCHKYLDNTDGGYQETERITCARCGYNEEVLFDEGPESLRYSEIDDCYYCENCSVYSSAENYWICVDDAVEVIIDKCGNTETYHITDSNIVLVNNEYYLLTHPHVVFDSTTNTYLLNDE